MFATSLNHVFARNTARALGAAAAFAVTALLPLQSHAGEDGYRTYSCVVLGDSQACDRTAEPSRVQVEQRVEPGTYAQYLKYLGVDEKEAIAQARSIGEVPTQRVIRTTQRELTAQEIYDRELGRSIAPERTEQVLSVAAESSTASPASRTTQQ